LVARKDLIKHLVRKTKAGIFIRLISPYDKRQSQPYGARLAALEAIRREYHQWKYGFEPRLQSVLVLVKRV
jgi:hypothetical protein